MEVRYTYSPETQTMERYYEDPADYNTLTYKDKSTVLENVAECTFNYSDGNTWQNEWSQDKDKPPLIIKVTYKFSDETKERQFQIYIPVSP